MQFANSVNTERERLRLLDGHSEEEGGGPLGGEAECTERRSWPSSSVVSMSDDGGGVPMTSLFASGSGRSRMMCGSPSEHAPSVASSSALPYGGSFGEDDGDASHLNPDVVEECFTEEDVLDFILRYARTLHECGLSSDKVEDKMTTVSETLGVSGSFMSLPTSMIISFPQIVRMPARTPSLHSSPGPAGEEGATAPVSASPVLTSPAGMSLESLGDREGGSGELLGQLRFSTHLVTDFQEKKQQRRMELEKRKCFASCTTTFKSSRTFLIMSSPSLNCEKLIEVSDVGNKLARGDISLSQGIGQLNAIVSKPWRSTAVVDTINFMLSSAALAPLFFGGDWIDAFISMCLGLMVGVLTSLTSKSAGLKGLLELLAALFTSIITSLLSRWLGNICNIGISLASIAWLMPGLMLTIAMQELAANSLVSGTARMFNAFLVLLEIGFGLTLGGRLMSYAWPGEDLNDCPGLSEWWNFLFVPVASISFQILMKAHPVLWIPQFLAAVGGYLINWASTSYLAFKADTAAAMAAFCMGLFANIWARWTGHPAAPVVISGILLLVPGSIGVRGVSAMMEDDIVQGMKFGYLMISIALSIAVGLLVSNLPFRIRSTRKASKYI